MRSFINIIRLDYLQRTRSYAFLITLCASMAIAYTFVPEPNASYSTIRISGYVGFYNSAWFGYVTAMMTSVFLSLAGFYLVNGSIKSDIDTKVGQIIGSTSITNFKYLFTKALSNFLVLLTIVMVIFTMSIVLFVLYNDGYPFEPIQFIKPYVYITLPALFIVAVVAVVFEVFFGKYSVLQNIGFFFIFSFLMSITPTTASGFAMDIFGNRIVFHQLEKEVKEISKTTDETSMSIGYIIGEIDDTKKFQFNGVDFPTVFIVSRLLLFVIGIFLIVMISPFFHRFNVKERLSKKKSRSIQIEPTLANELVLKSLAKPLRNYSVFPLVKTEALLLFRKGKKWLWILNIIGMVLLAVLPIELAHRMVLPILWFLQVGRLSDLTSKEMSHNVHYFAFASYKPIGRLLVSQLFAAILLLLLLALPLLVRLGISLHVFELLAVLLGAILLVVLAALLGVLSKGKKLFEVLFFMVTYANINGIPFLDYFGAFGHGEYYLVMLSVLIIYLLSISVLKRTYQLKQ